MTRVNIFDDGSAGSFLLKSELKKRNFEVNSIKVDGKDIVNWFTKVGHNQKTYLHFCYEDYVENHEHLRREIEKVERLGFRNDIVKEYEGLDRKTMIYRANKAGYEPKGWKPIGQILTLEATGEWTVDKSNEATIKQVKELYRIDPDDEMKSLGDFQPQLSDSDSDKLIDDALNEDKKPKKKRKLFKV